MSPRTAAEQHGGGLVGVDIGEVGPEEDQHPLGQEGVGVVHQGGQIQVKFVDEGGDADHDGEKGEDKEISQLGGGPADPFGEVHVHHVHHETDGRVGAEQLVQLVFHSVPLPSIVCQLYQKREEMTTEMFVKMGNMTVPRGCPCASCHARIGHTYGPASLRLGANPAAPPAWVLPLASVHPGLCAYPRASCHARIGHAAEALSLRLGLVSGPRCDPPLALAPVQAPLRGYPRASIPTTW